MIPNSIELRDIQEARERIASLVLKTPLHPSMSLSRRTGATVLYKLETTQPTRSFKVRGSGNVIAHLSPEQRECGMVTYSTGNHGKAASYIAAQLNSRMTVCISRIAPQNKVDGMVEYGGHPIVYGESQDEAMKYAISLVDERGYSLIDPINDPGTVCGHGTIGLEILEDIPDCDIILVPVSGGALISGIATAAKSINPQTRVIGISMEKGAAMYESLKAGRPVEVPEYKSLADSLQGGISLNNKYSFEIVKKLVDEILLVSEEEISTAISHAFFHDHIVLEGAGAVGIAALLSGKVESKRDDKIAIVCTGSNIDMDTFLTIVQKGKHP